MASVGHVAVGLAAARAYPARAQRPSWRSMAAWSALSLLPDLDVIGFTLGVPYGAPWGHRGATHSLAAAVVVGLGIGLVALGLRQPWRRVALFAIAVLASHGLLDAMTDGGRGSALLWPFDLTRYFAPWRPIPVAPIGLRFLSPGGLIVSLTEMVLFAPLWVYALRPARHRMPAALVGILLSAWVASLWLLLSADPVREKLVGLALREDTEYGRYFSETAFRSIAVGQPAGEVRHRLGPPVGESWFYPPEETPPLQSAAATSAASIAGCRAIRFEQGLVVAAFNADACAQLRIVKGTPADEVQRSLGSPRESCWQYAWSPGSRHHRLRNVCFVDSTVDEVSRGWR